MIEDIFFYKKLREKNLFNLLDNYEKINYLKGLKEICNHLDIDTDYIEDMVGELNVNDEIKAYEDEVLNKYYNIESLNKAMIDSLFNVIENSDVPAWLHYSIKVCFDSYRTIRRFKKLQIKNVW